jgi:hypothetical protein
MVTGYHGCLRDTAELLAAGDQWREGGEDWHWLSRGVYFFADWPGDRMNAFERAQRFARQRHPRADIAILEAQLDDTASLDLWRDRGDQELVAETYRRHAAVGTLPPQRPGHWQHFLDAFCIEASCQRLAAVGFTVNVVLGILDEYPVLYPATSLVLDPHLQISVREADAIGETPEIVWP